MISKLANHLLRSPAFWLGGTLLLAGIATNLAASDTMDQSSRDSPANAQEILLREGTRLESRVCRCHSDGDRLAIRLDEKSPRSLVVLENLAAGRILSAVLDDPTDQHWVVSGSVTEFQGRNYVFLERVARVSK